MVGSGACPFSRARLSGPERHWWIQEGLSGLTPKRAARRAVVPVLPARTALLDPERNTGLKDCRQVRRGTPSSARGSKAVAVSLVRCISPWQSR